MNEPESPTEAAPRRTWMALGRALRHRNFRLYFVGQGVSLTGSWLTRVATSWLVFRLTGSAWLLGLVGFVGQLPSFVLAPLAGVLVERWDRHRTLVVTQVLAMLQSALLAGFTLTGTIGVPHILLLSLFQGCINAFDTPARQAFVVEMVDRREDLPNAIALNSTMVNGARLFGPAVAAMLLAAVGEGLCFVIDAVSYAAVIGSLVAMRLAARPVARAPRRILADLHEGLRYVRTSGPIRSILVLLAITSLAAMPYLVLMPVFASTILHGGPHTLGALLAAGGVGAIAGTLWLASRESVLGLGRVVCIAGAVLGTSLIGFAWSRWIGPSFVLLVLAGGGMIVQMAASNTMLQTIVDEDKRGRVMSFYSMALFGMMPFGSLAGGWAAARIGAQATVSVGAVATLLGIAAFARRLPALRREVRPIYERLGIAPTVADGLGRATSTAAD